MKYAIYHPIGGDLNHNCTILTHEYELVAVVEADNIEGAFRMAQNDFNKAYCGLGIRSTSVGDVIKEQINQDICWMIMNSGYKQYSTYIISWIDWGNHMNIAKEPKPFEATYTKKELHKRAVKFFNRHHGVLNMGDMQSVTKFIMELGTDDELEDSKIVGKIDLDSGKAVMKETLYHIKDELGKLLKVAETISDFHHDTADITGTTTACVILQNMAHRNEDCVGYSLREDDKKVRDGLAVLQNMAEYDKQSHFLQFIAAQAELILIGADMSDDQYADEEEYYDRAINDNKTGF